MDRSMRLFSAALILAILVVATEIGQIAVEAGRTCQSPSHKFSGMCFFSGNCAKICKQEGFLGGDCGGFRRRCFCNKEC
ncbi:defensin Ec-AMP-D1-like [Rosa chinensis]|uniref:defensin Ec-AMP-D1-like n=1 Tax=Rosa chinensis TaxID=74649 RepID=UPI000D0937AB|nr:defensin Ec-AMP-D1-like [Rosa chinensis]